MSLSVRRCRWPASAFSLRGLRGSSPPPEGISNRDIVTTQWNQGFLRFLTVTIDESVTVTIRTGGGDGRLVIEGQLRGFPPPEAISDRDKCDKPMKSRVSCVTSVNTTRVRKCVLHFRFSILGCPREGIFCRPTGKWSGGQ